jgi:hypothetical protein
MPWKLYSTFSFHSADADTLNAKIAAKKLSRLIADRECLL